MIDGIPGPEEENNQVVSSRKWVETICLAAKSKQIREKQRKRLKNLCFAALDL